MILRFVPPAVSELFLPSVVARLLRGAPADLDAAIAGFLGSTAVASGSSWVLVLGLLLEELAARRPGRDEVVLPSYSCNEFTKATLLAGLRPRYVDLAADLAADPDAIAAALGPRTLAAFAINNVGRESENGRIRRLCDERGVLCVEDATYTFLGRSDHDRRRFGSYGHYAVLNFSEGKIVPVGGGAVLTNVAEGAAVIAAVRARIAARPEPGALRELVKLAIYRAGSSRLGYSAYRLLREASGTDLKKRLSMEPTRGGEVGHDLVRGAGGEVEFRPGRGEALRDTALGPLGRARRHCAIEVIRHADGVRAARRRRYEAFRAALAGLPHIEVLPYPEDGVGIKAPILVHAPVTDAQARALDRLGVIRGYASDYPTYGDAAFPNGNTFFDRLFTLPLHRYIGPRAIAEIARALGALEGARA